MSKNKGQQLPAKKEVALIRSSAAEYLTFIATSGKGGIEAVYADENIWLTQKIMGVLYDVETHTINYHLKKVFSEPLQDTRDRYASKTLAYRLLRALRPRWIDPKSRFSN